MINIFQPDLGELELNAVKEVFTSRWTGRGKKVAAFEAQFARLQKVEASSMIATTCATEGLFAAIELLGIKPEDEVIMPSIGFVATASAVKRVGAQIVLCDVNSKTLNCSLEDIKKVFTKKTKAVLLNHYGGFSSDVENISNFCKENNVYLIEDAACAVNSTYKGRALGTWGDIGIWSFDSMKVLVTGDGGMLYIKNSDRAKFARQHLYLGLIEGQGSGLEKSKATKDKWWEYQISCFGRRAIMNDITASIGLVQIERIQQFNKRRKEIAQFYQRELASLKEISLTPLDDADSDVPPYLYWIQTSRRDDLAQFLLDNGVYTTFRYWPLHRVELFKDGQRNPLPNSDKATETTLNIPCHQGLSDENLTQIVSLIRKFFSSEHP